MQSVKLNSGHTIPGIGFGTYLIKPRVTETSVRLALDAGYRHIDTAQLYGNEREVGRAVKRAKVDRDQVFVTTKLWETEWGYCQASSSIQERLASLDLGYIDLLLLHTPGDPALRPETWKALEEAQEQGSVRSIGVSNFGVAHLQKLLRTANVVPAVNQVGLSPFQPRSRLVNLCRSKGIVLLAASPLCQGEAARLTHPLLLRLAEEKGVSTAQILLRWSLQKGFVPLPKSTHKHRIIENIAVFGFELSADEMALLETLESRKPGPKT